MFIMKNENGSEKLESLDIHEHRRRWGANNGGDYMIDTFIDIIKAGQSAVAIVDVIISVDERHAHSRGRYIVDELIEIATHEKIFKCPKISEPAISLLRVFATFSKISQCENQQEEYLCKWIKLFKILHMGTVIETILNETRVSSEDIEN